MKYRIGSLGNYLEGEMTQVFEWVNVQGKGEGGLN